MSVSSLLVGLRNGQGPDEGGREWLSRDEPDWGAVPFYVKPLELVTGGSEQLERAARHRRQTDQALRPSHARTSQRSRLITQPS